uniref:Borealin N-terminal domain-containing protein n=1 Tax=Aplanochytrium stocchinoi TaxID=215587 RepID=A0A7S3LGU9_9STRA|mmetsp:Transcript_8432/g.9924  ORF Transcript_8432/g.9924 Transcript_8432/m.9924 type:complete len:281 (+) Transcript_8432:313-1155(+)
MYANMPVLRTNKKKAGTAPLALKKKKSALDELNIENFLEDLSVEIQSKCETIKWKADAMCDMIKNAYANEIFKLPKNIRAMNVGEFESKFGGDISLVVEHDRKKVCESLNVPEEVGTIARSTRTRTRMQTRLATQQGTIRRGTRVPRGGRNQNGVLQTPHLNPLLPKTPAVGNMVRQPRRGESIMSINGSPLGAVNSPLIRKGQIRATLNIGQAKPSKLAGDSEALNSTIAVALAGGKNINLNDPNAANTLTDEDKTEAMKQLAALQAQVGTLMQRIKGV